MNIELTTIIVDDYDEAIAFYTEALGFELVEDSPATTNDGRPKRWVVVKPPGAETGILLARADGDDQQRAVGTQFAGRVGMFLRVDDFDVAYERMLAHGVDFVSEPRDEPYGRFAVFRDIAGNRWDLLGPVPSDETPDEWDAAADGWDDDPIVRLYADAANTSLREIVADRSVVLDGAAVLDFGCGTGLLTERLADTVGHIDALDSSPVMLDVLRDKADRFGWSHVRAITDLPADARYDVIVASSVCSFLDDYPTTLRTLTSLLRPGGLFVQWDWERDEQNDDDHGLSRSEISSALGAAGCDDIEVRTAFSVKGEGQAMEPLVGIGRRITRKIGGDDAE